MQLRVMKMFVRRWETGKPFEHATDNRRTSLTSISSHPARFNDNKVLKISLSSLPVDRRHFLERHNFLSYSSESSRLPSNSNNVDDLKWNPKVINSNFCIIFVFIHALPFVSHFLPFSSASSSSRVNFFWYSLNVLFFCQQVTSGCGAVWRLITALLGNKKQLM